MKPDAHTTEPGVQVLKYVLVYRHKEHWSIQGNIDYAANPDDLMEKKVFLDGLNPHFKHWIERY